MDNLTSKNNDIEEADDRAMELNKELNRLRKRAEKLDRQNKTLTSELETLQNTLSNKSPVRSSPRTAVASNAPTNATPRVAPATTTISARSPGSGVKRRRDDEDERQRPAEPRVQAGPIHKTRSPFVARGSENAPIPADRVLSSKSAKMSTAARMMMERKAAEKQSPHPERKTLGAKNIFAQENVQ